MPQQGQLWFWSNTHDRADQSGVFRRKKGTQVPSVQINEPGQGVGLGLGVVEQQVHSAAFIWKPFWIMSAGSTGYSPEKQASQYCG